jgi:hypothetical protein
MPSGLPLARRGLEPGGFYRVRDSSWIRAMIRMDCAHPRHRAEQFVGYEHFILSFHDSTFECVARKVEVAPRLARGSWVDPRMFEMLRAR